MSRPAYLGGGRGAGRGQQTTAISHGRGRGKPNTQPKHTSPQQQPARSPPGLLGNVAAPSATIQTSQENARIAKANEIRASASKYADALIDSESSGSEDDEANSDILKATLKSYGDTLSNAETQLCKPNQLLCDVLVSRALTCLVCIESVKKQQEIWSCESCFCIFHINCIQQWARQSGYNPSVDDSVTVMDAKWFCPNCRREYAKAEMPSRYFCFCGKMENPQFDPWIVPHSCGQKCSKELLPACGHNCLLLCHPGACPPCPKTVRSTCHCGQADATARRCSNKAWSCSRPCNRMLQCGHHRCQVVCHPGDCPKCPRESVQSCDCKKQSTLRDCAEPEWKCDEVCKKELSCGFHICERVCHSGNCGGCPRQGKRFCPCGKSSFVLPCTEDIKSCDDICGKILACRQHTCTMLCHHGNCETCWHSVNKKCRCGKREKSMPCCQELVCNIKCTNLRRCGRHQCRRKCCDGTCPPCEQVCSRFLSCKNHKCPATCHQGMCYPCPLMTDVKCACGSTTYSVPCGRERTSKPPKCKLMCKSPPSCHHDKREPHRCHFGDCPNCTQTCNLALTECTHRCPEKCHQHVPDKEAMKPVFCLPWEKKPANIAFVARKCAPCQEPLTRWCYGKHEEETRPCCTDAPFSCRRPCGRKLPCGNHSCPLECHVVTSSPADGKAGVECTICEEPCTKPRPKNCRHECNKSCHPEDCPPCTKRVKLPCLCKSGSVLVRCSVFYDSDATAQSEMLSCKGICPQLIACGHQCAKTCHTGACSNVEQCEWKVRQVCPCKRKKKDFPCHVVRSSDGSLLTCDEKCEEIRARKDEEEVRQKELEAEAARKRDQEELDKFERKKHGGKKRKPKRQQEIEEAAPWYRRHGVLLVTALSALLFAILCVMLMDR